MTDQQPTNPAGAPKESSFPRYATFSDLIRGLEHGQLHGDLSGHVRSIVEELSNHALDHGGKAKGTLTLTLDFTLSKGVFQIDAEPKVKLPKRSRGTTMCWATPENNLSPQDPRQLQMFGPREVRDAHNAPSTGPARTA